MIIKVLLGLAALTGVAAVLIHRYLLDTPLPAGVEDPEPLRRVVATYNLAFYAAAATWMVGATRRVFEPVKLLGRILGSKNAPVEFPGLQSRTELILREDGTLLPMKIDSPQQAATPDSPRTPCIIYLHGGGYTLNNPAVYHAITGNLSITLKLPVFTPDYRKSPQWTHPAALEDALTTLRHVKENAARYNIDPDRIVLAGDSAGAHLSIASTLHLLTQKQPIPAALVLLYPATQLVTTCLPSHIENRFDIFLSESTASAFRLSYLVGNTADLPVLKANNHSSRATRSAYAEKFGLPLLANPCPGEPENSPGLDWAIERYRFAYEDWLLSPLFAPQELLSQFPPSLLQTCQFDILRDEGYFFYERLRQSRVAAVEHKRYASLHGMAPFVRVGHRPAVAAMDDAKAFLRRILALKD